MKCEICDTATATMWMLAPLTGTISSFRDKPILSCGNCGPYLGYKILAALEPTKAHVQKLLGSS